MILRSSLIAISLLFFTASSTFAIQSFEESVQREVVLKKSLPIYIQHKVGNVAVQGWVQDRIRVTLKKRVLAESETLANREFKKFDLISLETESRFEMRVGHTQGIDLVTKMHDSKTNQVQVDVEIKAPYQSNLTVVLGEQRNFKLLEWRGGIEVTGRKGSLEFSKLTLNESISVNCIQCATTIKDSKLNGHLLMGSSPLLLVETDSPKGLTIDAGTEEIKVENSRGRLFVNSKSGRLTATKFVGMIHFQSADGGAFLSQVTGGASVQSQTGQVILDFDKVDSKLTVDTEKSDIQISLPPSFSGDLDLMSLRGETVVQFPVDSKKRAGVSDLYGPPSLGRIEGMVGTDETVQIHAYSKQGGVRILRKTLVK